MIWCYRFITIYVHFEYYWCLSAQELSFWCQYPTGRQLPSMSQDREEGRLKVGFWLTKGRFPRKSASFYFWWGTVFPYLYRKVACKQFSLPPPEGINRRTVSSTSEKNFTFTRRSIIPSSNLIFVNHDNHCKTSLSISTLLCILYNLNHHNPVS